MTGDAFTVSVWKSCMTLLSYRGNYMLLLSSVQIIGTATIESILYIFDGMQLADK